MTAPKFIIITDVARIGTLKIVEYLITKFSESIANRFVKELNIVFSRLSRFPELGFMVDEEIRCFVFKKHTLIFYSYDQYFLTIMAVRYARESFEIKLLI